MAFFFCSRSWPLFHVNTFAFYFLYLFAPYHMTLMFHLNLELDIYFTIIVRLSSAQISSLVFPMIDQLLLKGYFLLTVISFYRYFEVFKFYFFHLEFLIETSGLWGKSYIRRYKLENTWDIKRQHVTRFTIFCMQFNFFITVTLGISCRCVR